MQVLRIDDTGSIPVPVQADGNYTPDYIKEFRTDLKPLEIQADGPSFTVHGNEVLWQKWRFRVGFTPREGLVLYTISYTDQGRVRPLIYRASLVDMVVPYGDPHPITTVKTPLMLANMVSACWQTRWRWAVTVWGISTTSMPR